MVGLIPARSGSQRIKDKNIRRLKGKPLMSYTITEAIKSGVFSRVIVSTDSIEYKDIADRYDAEVVMRPPEIAKDTSKDVEWVKHIMEKINEDSFSILRPTSPFRTAETIQRGYDLFNSTECDSIRAVEKCKQHPEKMWTVVGEYIIPYTGNKLHSQPYQTLPEVYVQNASLEMAKTQVLESNSICGLKIVPFFTYGYEGFDINDELDWVLAEWIADKCL